LEQQLAELEGQRRPDPKAIKAKRQELLKARMSYLYPQADLRAILSRTAAVPNTGELPIVALFPLGNPGDVERQCTISTQAWYRRDGEPAQFTSNVPLMAKLADLTRAISGNEAGTGFRLNWAAGLRGPFPPEAINEARRHGLFASAGGTATVPGGTRRGTAIGDGGAVELPEGTTVTALAPASWTEWDDDPIFVASLEENGQETSWIIAGDLALGRFILGGVGLRRFVGLGKTNA